MMSKQKLDEQESGESDKNKQNSKGVTLKNTGEEFSELEKSRMENPPEERETNGSEKQNKDEPEGHQSDGV